MSHQSDSSDKPTVMPSTQGDFKQWLTTLKADIRRAQLRAALSVNSELLHLYWRMGRDICAGQQSASWGDGWLRELSRELMAEFPSMKGFSYRNLRYMRQWYQFYSQALAIGQQAVAQLGDATSTASSANWQQAVANLGDAFFAVPWGHHLYIMAQCKGNVDKALFFLRKTVENNWSRSLLLNHLDTDLYERQGKAVSNFARLLPAPQGDLAQQTLKDPYCFDFLTLTDDYREKELEDALTANITKFLLELGSGFAYVGRQVPLEVGDDTVFADMLFYHLELRCYVVIELKTTKFSASYLGQLGLYVSAVNHLKRKDGDNPTIGLLICKTKNNVMAQYALEATSQPIGISEYSLSHVLPKEIQSQLPTIDEIESSLKG